jgi:hypothetical protein
MHGEVKVVFEPDQQFDLLVAANEVSAFDAARKWLDEQFIKNGCEPMRGSGKVLIADKILGIAAAVGPAAFADKVWAQAYAIASLGALGKSRLSVDVAKLSLSY